MSTRRRPRSPGPAWPCRAPRAGVLWIAAVLACGAAEVADASCALALEGDEPTVVRIRAALDAFGAFDDDDTACVALRAVCGRDDGEITLELHDALGRVAQRRFSRAEGAAAFLMSWSRRPRLIDGAAIPRGAAPAGVATATAAAAPHGPAPGDGLHGELHLAYIVALDSDRQWLTAMGALVQRRGIWRYGADLRVIGAPVVRFAGTGVPFSPWIWLGFDAEATFGAVWTPRDDLMVRGEVGGGAAYVTMLTSSGDPNFQTQGLRGGLRGAVSRHLASALWLEVGAGWDVLRQYGSRPVLSPFGPDPIYHQLHFEIGLQWSP